MLYAHASACSSQRVGCVDLPIVRITLVAGQEDLPLLLEQHPPTGEQFHQSGDELVQNRLQRLVGRLGSFDELRRLVNVAPVHAAQNQAAMVNARIAPASLSRNQVITRCTIGGTGVASLGRAYSS
jgi:hypothetical protein